MRLQPIAVLTLIGALSLPASAQDRGVYSRAVPPDQSAIERLNLKTVWTVNLPVSGRKDSIAHIQPLDDQVFVQTRAGLLIALDALTGRVQWSAQLGAGNTVSTYPVAANSRFVFAANLTKLYSFHRYTGVVDFTTEMGSPPTAGLAADETGVYCALEGRTGSSGANRVLVYDLPPPIAITVPPGRSRWMPTASRSTTPSRSTRSMTSPNAMLRKASPVPATPRSSNRPSRSRRKPPWWA